MKVYVVLHGQTDFDAEGRIIGDSDPSLNDTGKEQAKNAAGELCGKGIDMILSAPEKRAMETSEIIADGLGLDKNKITKGLKLCERAFGDHCGKLVSEVDMFALDSWVFNAATPNGETIKDTLNRVIAYMNNMVKIFRTKTMLLVVPEHICKALFWFFNGLPEPGKEQIRDVEHCKVYEFDTDNIPQTIKDYSPLAVVTDSGSDDGGANDPGRLLSQSEIDALVAELQATA
ncbi:MAG: phosphoglycerate mutase family protein [Oscillospiraceae bacterium]|nr:phosphoglycerate mutase family protein [Oscillospiraceae bacterium]